MKKIDGPFPEAVLIVRANQLFIAKDGLPPAMLNRILRIAAFQNPEFYKAQAMRLSTFNKPRVISCGDDLPRHLALPRGCLPELEALLRYNRLIDIFLGITTYSLQNHLRTTVKRMGQIEIDEIYVGVNKTGRQFVIPVQAKGGADKLAVIQTSQDLAYCAGKFPGLTARAISAQFMKEDVIAIFELTIENDEVKVVEERHYRLVPAGSITVGDLRNYANR